MSTSGTLDITIEQGANFRLGLTWKTRAGGENVDLTGSRAEAQVRKAPGGPVLLDLDPQIVDGRIVFDVSAEQTALASWTDTARWDLLIIAADDSATRVVHGTVRLSRAVTVAGV